MPTGPLLAPNSMQIIIWKLDLEIEYFGSQKQRTIEERLASLSYAWTPLRSQKLRWIESGGLYRKKEKLNSVCRSSFTRANFHFR